MALDVSETHQSQILFMGLQKNCKFLKRVLYVINVFAQIVFAESYTLASRTYTPACLHSLSP
jgi:hypothetical protein